MELKNQPNISLELRLRKALVITTLSAVVITASFFIYTSLTSSPDTFAGTQGTSSFSCNGVGGVEDNSTNRFYYDLDSMSYDDGDGVSTLTNMGGNGAPWTQSTSGNQPIYKTGASAMNGHPVMYFDGSNDYLKMADQNDLNKSGSTERTYTVVFRTSDDISTRQVLYEEGGATRGINIYINSSKICIGAWNRNDDGSDAPWSFVAVDSTVAINTEYIVTMVYDGSTDNTTSGHIIGYLNGGYMGIANSVGKLYSHGDDIGLGAMNGNSYFENGSGSGTGHYFKGDIATFVEYNFALDTAQRNIMENSLSSKFGIAIANDLYSHDVAGYDNDVAGIGKTLTDENICAASGGMIQISNPTDLDAGEYLLFGYNLETGASTSDNPNSINNRWNRNLAFEEIGDVGNVDIIFSLDQSEFTITEESDLRLMVDLDGDGDMTDAQVITGTYSSSNNTITFSGVTVGNDVVFTVGSVSSANALPVEFIRFTADKAGDVVELNWATATETNNSHFIVQRTHDGASWEEVTEVAGAGFSNDVLVYDAIDNNPYDDVNYYRIKQVDYDGQFDFSEIVMVNSLVEKAKVEMKMYPNPASDFVSLELGEDEGKGKVLVQDLSGKFVSEHDISPGNVLTLDITGFKNGIYFIQFASPTSSRTERLVVRH